MLGIPNEIKTWQMIEAGKNGSPGKFKYTTLPVPKINNDEALVEISGCGICHTDLSFYYDSVPTINKTPLTLGHEISGTIVAGPNNLIGKNVIVPAVMPCNNCNICIQGRGNRCLSQKMPGNSLGIYGGFASHIPVPIQDLCIINQLKMPLSYYAVIADAATTPYQAAIRANIRTGDLIIIVGAAGGIGTFMTQIAKTLGAKIVIAIDINEIKLKKLLNYGADYIIISKNKENKDIRNELYNICEQTKLPKNIGWKIFECSGVTLGQEIALGLLSFIGKLIIIGFTSNQIKYSISRLMAFDAEIIGSWGCLPKYYPEVLDMVQNDRIKIEPFLEIKPMSQIQQIFEDQHNGLFERRQILQPDF